MTDGDRLHAARTVAASVSVCPLEKNDLRAAAGVADGVAVTDGHRTARILSRGDTRIVRAGVGWAFEDYIWRTGDRRSSRVTDGDRLHTTDTIAAGVGCGPGARDDLRTAAGITDGIAIAN